MGTARKARVLCVTSNYPRWPGDSTTPFVHHLAQDLQEQGWDVTILAPHAEGTSLTEIMDGVRVIRFRYLWPARLETVCYKGGALANLRQDRTNYLKLPFLVLSEFVHIARMISSRQYDILHSHWVLPQGLIGTMAARIFKIPHAITIHGSDVFSLNSKILLSCKAFALRRADGVTVNSSATEKAAREICRGIKRLHRIPMGINTDIQVSRDDVARLKQDYNIGNGPLLLFIGRIVEEKGIGDLLKATALLREHYPTIRLLIIGEGQDKSRFEDMARSLGLERQVIFTGWMPAEKIPLFLGFGGIYVGPSWSEGQGLSFLEAMLAGAPVIGTRVGGIPDAVHHETTGLLVNLCSPREIAASVTRLLSDPELTAYIRNNARQLVLNNYSRNVTARSFSDLFRCLMASSRQ